MLCLPLVAAALAADIGIGATSPTALAGGPGGGAVAIGCGADEVAMGMAAEWGTLYGVPAMWRLQLRCAEPDVIEAELTWTGSSGTDGLGSEGNATRLGQSAAYCPLDTWLVGATVHHDVYITGIEPHCAPMSWSSGEVVLGAVTVQPLVGASGTATDLLCGPGEAVAGISGRAGWVVDAVGMTCVVLDEGTAVCGDGAVDTGESCDDANAVDTDGCSGCAVDAGWTCVGDPSVCTQLDTGMLDTARINDTGTTLPSTTDTALGEATEPTETMTTDSTVPTTSSPPGAPLTGEAVDGCACGSSPPGRSWLWAWPIARLRGL